MPFHLAGRAALVLWFPLGLLGPIRLVAQSVTVEVGADGGKPLAGALISLRDARGRAVRRTLADEAGRARIEAPAGRYQVRVDGIGFAGVTTDWITLEAGTPSKIRVTLTPQPLDLGELVVKGKHPVECRLGQDEGTLVARIWGEARKALLATQLTSARGPLLEVRTYERDLDLFDRIRVERADSARQTSARPFVSADPETLHREGYVFERSDGTWYNAPDADLLLSERFLDDHCFGIAPPGPGGPPNAVGLTFEPTRARRVPEVYGTLWLDQTTAELRFLEYGYRNVSLPDGARDVGGRLEFEKLPNGWWIVGRWRIRMPRTLSITSMAGRRLPGAGGGRDSLLGYREAGGTAILANRVRSDPRAIGLTGLVTDSSTGFPLPGTRVSIQAGAYADTADQEGRYRIRAPATGHYAVTFAHPALELFGLDSIVRGAHLERGRDDTVNVAVPLFTAAPRAACPEFEGRPELVLWFGRVVDSATGKPIPGARIRIPLAASGRGVEFETVADQRGRFRGCAAIGAREVIVHAAAPSGKRVTRKVSVPAHRLLGLELTVP